MVTFFKLAGLAAFAGVAFSWWLLAPVPGTLGVSLWIGIGASAALLLGAFGAAQTRAWVGVPLAVTAGLVLGAAWVDWRVPSAISNHRQFVLPGALVATIGVLLVRLAWVLLYRWAMKQARSGPSSR